MRLRLGLFLFLLDINFNQVEAGCLVLTGLLGAMDPALVLDRCPDHSNIDEV